MARLTKVATPLLLIMSVSPALADEGASGLYVPGNFGFGAGVTPDPGQTNAVSRRSGTRMSAALYKPCPAPPAPIYSRYHEP